MESKFIEPDYSLAELSFNEVHKALGINIYSGYKADFSNYNGMNYLFDDIVNKMQLTDGYEDQCSSKYYFDLFNCVKSNLGEITRIVEVGVFMGGASSILAGCASRMG